MSGPAAMFVLDTTVASQLIAKEPDPAVMEWLEAAPVGSLCIPVGAVYEMQLGVELARRNGNRRADWYQRRLDELVSAPRHPVVGSDARTARLRAVLAADPGLRHLALADPRAKRPAVTERLAIAATAMSMGASVATLDRRTFCVIAGRHGLNGVYDPSADAWMDADVPERQTSSGSGLADRSGRSRTGAGGSRSEPPGHLIAERWTRRPPPILRGR